MENRYPVTQQDLQKIYQCAKEYEENLQDKALVFFFERENKTIGHECVEFRSENFSHLIGVERNRENGISAEVFYQKALSQTLKPNEDFVFANEAFRGRANFDLKMEIINRVFSIDNSPLQLGTFDDSMFLNLTADKVLGHKSACLAVELQDMNFYPKSVINKDFRECVFANTICPVLLTAKYDLGKDALNSPLEITRLSNAVDKKRAEKIFQSLNDFSTKGVESSLFSGLKMNEDFEELLELSDYYKQKATKVLGVIAKENGWEHYSIVEDSSYFQDGLRVIGYDSEDAKLGLIDGGELGSECIDVLSLKYDLVISDKELDCTLDEFLKEYNIDNLEDVKTQDFIDAQGLRDEVHALQRADASFANPLKFTEIETPQDVRDWVEQVDESIMNCVIDKENPKYSMMEYLKNEAKIEGSVDKYSTVNVMNVSADCDKVLQDDVRQCLFHNGVELPDMMTAQTVWEKVANDNNLEINQDFVDMIKSRDVQGIEEWYSERNTIGTNNEIVYLDRDVLCNLVNEEYIDNVNHNQREVSSYQQKESKKEQVADEITLGAVGVAAATVGASSLADRASQATKVSETLDVSRSVTPVKGVER